MGSEEQVLTDPVKQKFGPVFNGVGKLKNYQLKLHQDENVQPIAQKAHHLPVTLRKAVQEKVEELINQDIAEPMKGLTTWSSPFVVTPTAVRRNQTLCRYEECQRGNSTRTFPDYNNP